jgi:hypothetical protein
MVLTYNEYVETLAKQKAKEEEIEGMKKEMNVIKQGQRELFELMKPAKRLLDILENDRQIRTVP